MSTEKSIIGAGLWALAFLLLSQPAQAAPARLDCKLTQQDLDSNSRLAYSDFDQEGSTKSSARALSDRDCHAAAAAAAEDYLARGPISSPGQQRNIAFHMAQELATKGDYRTALVALSLSRDPSQGTDAPFDWNTYVAGMRAFLKRDLPLLQESIAVLASKPGRPNVINAAVLQRLERCFRKPYRVAYSSRCSATDQ